MPKQVYHIKAFEGGINKKADPRDIEDSQVVEATNVSVSNVGRVTMPGNGKSSFVTVNAGNVPVSPTDSEGQDRFDNETPISSGHGLFSFTHDYDFRNTSVTGNTGPNEINTEFICVNDGADIDIWTDNSLETGYGAWKDSFISMGTVHNTGTDGNSENLLDVKGVKPVYYKADNGLRVCDANFGEEQINAKTSGAILLDSTVTFDVDAGHGLLKKEYIKIDSEVMKITTSNPTSLVVERGRFGTKIENHDDDSIIFKINVPKIFTHIKRPMLKNAGANTDINRWVQDIQVPESPKFDDLVIRPIPILGNDGSATPILTENSIYPTEPEKVNLGLQYFTTGGESDFYLDDVAVTNESGTSTQTVLVIVIADADSDAFNLTNEGFAIGKFVSISGCEGDGVALNGVHEIVGFGTSTGQIKIEADDSIIGYTPAVGACEVILEDELMDDNLKNKYIFGMSYLYDGGGSEMQESNVTTGTLQSTVQNFLIDVENSQFNLRDSKWKTADSSFGTPVALSSSATDNWQWKARNYVKSVSTGNDSLYFETGASVVAATKNYKIATKVSGVTAASATLKYYVGRGPGAPDLTTDMSNGTHYKTITADGAYIFEITCPASPDVSVPVAIQATGASGGIRIHFVMAYEVASAPVIMDKDNAIDFRFSNNLVKSQIAFLCNNSRVGEFNNTTPNNSWNERIEGFRIYIKQVDIIGGGLAEEWVMLYDVDLKEGTYVMHAKDGDVENLRKGDIDGEEWGETQTDDMKSIVTGNLSGDSIKNTPLLTYESNNGYEADTNLAARYKATATVDRKVYIGNLKIGDKTFPDRMLRSDTDKFDTFPDDGTHFIDVATSDGESIVALESVGDKLIQYKEKTAYLIKVTSEGEELVSTFFGAGIKNSCQVAKSTEGIFWVNSNGIYYYDGEKLSNVSADKFRIDNWLTNEDFKRPVIVGYDKYSNKLIILTTNISGASSSGYIYDIANSSITQHDNLFNWYQLSNPSDVIMGNTESEL
jgi:hypothetical protein